MFFNFIFLICVFFNSLLCALEYKSEENPINVEIMPKNAIFKNGQDYFFGIKFNLENGWKTYWKNPGDAGEPLQLDWEDKKNQSKLELLFPFPEEFVEKEVTTIGYDKETIFPVKITENKLQEINGVVVLNYLLCREVCIPFTEKKKINLDFTKIIHSDDFYRNVEMVPKKSTNFFLVNIDDISSDRLIVEIKNNNNKQHKLFAFSNEVAVKVIKKNMNSKFEIILDESIKKVLKPLYISVSDGKRYEEISLKLNQEPKTENLLVFLFFAFLGGFILNFMPCVLPVLSLKLYHFSSISSKTNYQIKMNCVWIVLGIIVSFFMLAIIIIILKFFGQTVGWGFQFQNPYFLYFMTAIIFIFSLNLLGFFEIILPNEFQNKITNLSIKNSAIGHFSSGIFATLLATPCSAPFLGTAVGFSMLASNTIILLIFLTISIGFCIPYLFFLIFPRILNIIPKPGEWIISFKYFLGILLFLSSLWLMMLSGLDSKIIFLLGSVVIIFSYFKNKIFLGKLVVAIFFIFSTLYFIKYESFNRDRIIWTSFNRENLEKLINQNNTIIVDVTADWCVTCKINKLTTLDSNKLMNFIKKNKVITMRADWTKKNEDILEYIKEYGRFGIPVNIIYGPNNKNGILLPEILTSDIVINELNKVGINENQRESSISKN